MSAEQRKPLSEDSAGGSSKRFVPTPKMGVVGSSGIRIFVSKYDIRDADRISWSKLTPLKTGNAT
jgi:hypothetical protein